MQRTIGALAIVLALTLSGCAASPGFAIFDREPSARDELPASLPEYAADGLEVDSIRLVDELDGVAYFLARTEADEICLLLVAASDDWVRGCAGTAFSVSGVGVTARVVPDGYSPPDGWSAVGENVIIER